MVWLLLGNRRGDNNQMLALAESLGLPFEAKTLSYNALRHFTPLRRGLIHVDRRSRDQLTPPWPDLVIGVGPNSLPVAREIRRRSGGHTRVVQIGDPRSSIGDIDLVIATPQFAPREGKNVLPLRFPIGNPASSAKATREEQDWLDRLPRPRRLVAVGGSTRKWKVDDEALGAALALLQSNAKRQGGSVIAVTSPRTAARTRAMLERRLTGKTDALAGDFPRFAILLAAADEIHVTADSVSMLSEAILTGKPVGMIPISRTFKGRLSHWLRRLGMPYRADLANFWKRLTDDGLVGTVAAPVASQSSDTVATAVAAVLDVLHRPEARGAPEPRIWALLGAHRGDNNQILALAESLGLPFEIKPLRYNPVRHLHPRFLRTSLTSLTKDSRALIAGDPPDLTISCGHRSVPVVQALRRRSAGRTRSVHIGYPRLSPGRFDLVVTTPEYPVPDHPKVMRVPFALSRSTNGVATGDDLIDAYPSPRRVVVIGGPTLFWRVTAKEVLQALDVLLDRAREEGGSVLAIGSPRTPPGLLDAVARRLDASDVPTLLAPTDGRPGYASLLASADSIYVTADSVAMVGDAVRTGKPVGLIPIRPTALGRAYAGLLERIRPGMRMHPRDLRCFWAALAERRLAGTVEEPRAAERADDASTIAHRASRLLQR